MVKDILRSPFFYVGDKYKLMPQLRQLMPTNINQYIEPFVGGGSSVINSDAKQYIVNDIDSHVIELHLAISKYANSPDELFSKLFELIDYYGLSCSFRGHTAPQELKTKYVKTYYSHYNKESYCQMKNDYNRGQNDNLLLYLLLIYGFNHMIRYNSDNLFNLPVGNVDFNKNVYNALVGYLNFMSKNHVEFHNHDYQHFLNNLNVKSDSFIFLDPPYLISMSEYNRLWNDEKEHSLCQYLDKMNDKGIRFGITNLLSHKGKFNTEFSEWAKNYRIYDVKSNYISFNDNSIKESSKEIYVTNI